MSSWWSRLNNGFNAFRQAVAGSAYGVGTSFLPLEGLGWATYAQRSQRYDLFDAFHNNIVYDSIYRVSVQRGIGSYKHRRGVYNPCARQNDLLRAFVYGGAVDMQDLTGGSVPIVTDNPALIDPLKLLFTWSRLPELLPLWVGKGAKLGDAPIKIIDDTARGKVRFELLDPRKVRDVTFDAVGNVKAIVIEYERDEEADLSAYQPGKVHPLEAMPRSYLYTEIIDHDPQTDGLIRFRTFKDGEAFAFNTDSAGREVAEWFEDYGYVPIVWAGQTPTEFGFYDNAFSHSIGKIDEINDAASLLNDQIRKSVNVIWAYTGVRATSEINFETTARDQTPFVTLPAGADAKPLVAQLQIGEALENLREMLQELERDMPELALQRVREHGAMTAPGIRAGYSDAIGRIQLARSSYNSALVRALQMGLTIAGMRGYDGFAGITLDSYADGDLDFHIGERPVIADELTKSEKITALGSTADQPSGIQRLVLEEMGYSKDTIDEVVAETTEQQERQSRAAADALAQRVFPADDTADPVDEEADVETEAEQA